MLIFVAGSIFHFGILFENPTFKFEVNGEVASEAGQRQYLLIENNTHPNGVTFYLFDNLGK